AARVRRRRRSRAGGLLEWEQERFVRRAGGLLQPQLAGPVAGHIPIHAAFAQLGRLVARGGGGQLGVQEPPVAGEPAAGRRGGDEDLVGQRAGELRQLLVQAQVPGR